LALEYMQAEGTSAPAADVRTLAWRRATTRFERTSGASRATGARRFAFESGEIVPAPDDCREGKHPGCDVYDRWKKAVTGKLGAEGEKPRPPKTEDLIRRPDSSQGVPGRPDGSSVERGAGALREAVHGEWCEGLAKDKKFKDRIDLAKLQREKQQDQAEICARSRRRWSGARRSCSTSSTTPG